jgi:hypothetical protein
MEVVRGAVNNWTFLGPVVLAFHQEGELEPARWKAFIEDLKTHTFTHCFGGAWGAVQLTSVQRREVTEQLKGVPSALVTNHAVARGIVTAVGWLGMTVRGFGWDKVDEAAQYLSPPEVDYKALAAAFVQLRDASLPFGRGGQ